jgi:superfamily II DNA or RNA helicase
MKYLDTDGYHISKSDLTTQEYKNIKKELSVSPSGNLYSTDPIVYKQYKTTETEIIIPKFYGIEKFGFPEHSKYTPDKANINFITKLHDYQIPIVKKCVKHIKEHGGCQLSVPCGRGKTVMAINIAHQLKLKTLVLVHKSFLQDQWVARIEQFTGEKAGIIRMKKAEVEGKMFCVGMIQSIGSRDYGDIFRNFGLIICDESHHYASEWFSNAISKVTGLAYTLGLSATLYRNDGLVRIINWYLGNVAYKEKMKSNNQVSVKVLTYTSSDKEKFVDVTRNFKGRALPDCTSMINNLVEIDTRNNLIISIVDQLRQDPDRKILILSGRKETHLHKLKAQMDELIAKDIAQGKILKDECRSYFYTGDTKQAERFEAEKNADILFATYDMAQEALDIPRLNTLILSTPKKDVVQAVGRVLRKILRDGDIRPMIIDIVDNFSLFKNQSLTREKFYEANDYVLQYYYILDNKFISPKEYLELNGIPSENACEKSPTGFEQVLCAPPVETKICDDSSTDSKKSNSSKNKLSVFDVFSFE